MNSLLQRRNHPACCTARVALDDPALYDLTVAVLDEYGISKHPEMIGQDCLGP